MTQKKQIPRRDLIKTGAIVASAAAGIMSLNSARSSTGSNDISEIYFKLDEILKKPVLDRSLFPDPVIIEWLELLRDRKNFICRVRAKDGAKGISLGHPRISSVSYPVFNKVLQQQFVGKDARDLDQLIYKACHSKVKYQGVPTKIQIATIEFAILDMLGNIANLPIGAFLGGIKNPEISIYLGTRLLELRGMEPEASLALMEKDVLETNAQAIKLRAGRGQNMASDMDSGPGRTEKLIRMAREKFGDKMVLMIDGNGSYSVKEAIRIGKILEEYNYYFFEAPLPWDWYEEMKPVQAALSIPLAGGEVENRMHSFRWQIANETLQIAQPDIFYFGGMIRSIKVARMAEAVGMTLSPHLSSGLGYLYMLHMLSAAPAIDRFHEFKMFTRRDANGTLLPIESKTEPIQSINGVIKVPTGSGLGIRIDPDYIKTHKAILI
ncbi:mandelate racemase/muconate lactonizing enzyme family protein [Planctomycetota bacterium]